MMGGVGRDTAVCVIADLLMSESNPQINSIRVNQKQQMTNYKSPDRLVSGVMMPVCYGNEESGLNE